MLATNTETPSTSHSGSWAVILGVLFCTEFLKIDCYHFLMWGPWRDSSACAAVERCQADVFVTTLPGHQGPQQLENHWLPQVQTAAHPPCMVGERHGDRHGAMSLRRKGRREAICELDVLDCLHSGMEVKPALS